MCLQILSVIFWGLFLFATLPSTESSRCPISDGAQAEKENNCPSDTNYHCFENKRGNLASDGCFKVKPCLKGAHPQVQNGAILCSICKTGFQGIEPLQSNRFHFSYCKSYSSECDTTSGYYECKAPSPEEDRGCGCSAEHGYIPDPNTTECACFTQENACNCRFVGCPPGKVLGREAHLGLCVLPSTEEPRSTTLSNERTTIMKDEKETDSNRATAFPFAAILIIISLCMLGTFGVGYFIHWKCFRDSNHYQPTRDQSQTMNLANGTHPNGVSVIQMEGQVTHPASPGHQPEPQPSVVYNIVAKKVHIGNEITTVNTVNSPMTGGIDEEAAADSEISLSMNGPQETDGMEETAVKVPLLAAGEGMEETAVKVPLLAAGEGMEETAVKVPLR